MEKKHREAFSMYFCLKSMTVHTHKSIIINKKNNILDIYICSPLQKFTNYVEITINIRCLLILLSILSILSILPTLSNWQPYMSALLILRYYRLFWRLNIFGAKSRSTNVFVVDSTDRCSNTTVHDDYNNWQTLRCNCTWQLTRHGATSNICRISWRKVEKYLKYVGGIGEYLKSY